MYHACIPVKCYNERFRGSWCTHEKNLSTKTLLNINIYLEETVVYNRAMATMINRHNVCNIIMLVEWTLDRHPVSCNICSLCNYRQRNTYKLENFCENLVAAVTAFLLTAVSLSIVVLYWEQSRVIWTASYNCLLHDSRGRLSILYKIINVFQHFRYSSVLSTAIITILHHTVYL